MHQNALRDPQITPVAKTQVWHNVSHRTIHGICIGSTGAGKIVHHNFVPRTYQNGLRDLQIPPDTKYKFSVTCPIALYVASVPVSSEHQK
jgi:hypothetical protein